MTAGAPLIDPRTEQDLTSQTEALVQAELSLAGQAWTPSDAEPDMAHALVRIFARMARHVVENVNRIPERTAIEFLNLIGAAPRPPNAARAPLTFSLFPGAAADVLLPAGAAAAAPPPEGETEDLIFETESPLLVMRARLSAMIVHRPEVDLFADRTPLEEAPCPLLEVNVPTPHHLFVDGGEIFALPEGTQVRIELGLPPPAPGVWSELPLAWTYWDGEAWQPFPDGGAQSEVVVDQGTGARAQVITFALPASIERRTEGGREGRFARGALGVALPDDSVVPMIHEVKVSAAAGVTGRPADHGFSGGASLDMSLDHRPFGERPRVGDAFFLASEEVFSKAGAAVTLNVTRSPAAGALKSTDDPTLLWEVWTTAGWLEIGRSDKANPSLQPLPLSQPNTAYAAGASPHGFADGTLALRQDGAVTFTLPGGVAPRSLNGVTSHWLRVRIAKGTHVYGLGITISLVDVTVGGSTVKVASATDDGVRPPVLASLSIDYQAPALPPAALLVENDFRHTDHTGSAAAFAPFTHDAGDGAAMYLGFDQPFDERAVSLFFDLTPPSPAEISAGALLAKVATPPPELVWEYSSADGWSELRVEDDTMGLRQTGALRFVAPGDLLEAERFGRRRYWVRMRLVSGDFSVVPRLRCVRTNTVWARQVQTRTGEILGSSDGRAHQALRLLRGSVLEGARIEVLEPAMPSPDEEAELRRILGEGAVTPVLDEHGHPAAAWVRWREVTDFHASGPADRHYVLDHATGDLRFGGLGRGLAPPIGTDSVRAGRYQVSGGALGNVPRGAIARLVTAPASIAGVTNPIEAEGGSDIEATSRVLELGPRLLRHGDRAVAADDYEELARRASPLVARAWAITPGFSALDCPLGVPSPPAGLVLVIVLPVGTEARPTPTLALLDVVGEHLRARAAPAVRLLVSGPDWVRVTVDVEVVSSSADAAETADIAVSTVLERTLHPLGGPGGSGWELGSVPRASDLYTLLMAIPEVDHVGKLHVVYERETPDGAWVPHDPDLAGATRPRTLIFSGPHTVSVRLPDGG